MTLKSAVYWMLAITVIGSCAESDLDPKVRWGAALKGVMGSIELAAQDTATGPLDTLCGETPTIPTNCIVECAVADPATGWYLSATMYCANQPPDLGGSGLWEVSCGLFREGLQAGQDEQTSHILQFTAVKPTERAAGAIDIRFSLRGDIFIMPYAIDKVWVNGVYYFSKALDGNSNAFTAADMEFECKDDSIVGVDMAPVPCQTFKETYYDAAVCV